MNYSFLLIFILAHLAGDFTMQTDSISKNKSASIRGLAVHAGIVVLLQAGFLCAYGLKGALLGVVSGLIHFGLDFLKETMGKNIGARFWYYLFDQLLHITVIVLLTLFFAPSRALLPIDDLYVKISIIAITLIFVSNITAKILVRDLNEGVRKEPFFKKNERITDAIICIAVFLAMFLSFPVFLIPAALGYYPYARFMKTTFGYPFAISAVKYGVYVLFSIAMYLFLKAVPL